MVCFSSYQIYILKAFCFKFKCYTMDKPFMKGHDRRSIECVFVDVGNGLGTALSIIGGRVILFIAGRCQRRKEQNDPNRLLDKMMMLFHEDGFQASTYFFSEQVDKGFAIDDELKKMRYIEHQPGGSTRKNRFAVTELSLKNLKC